MGKAVDFILQLQDRLSAPAGRATAAANKLRAAVEQVVNPTVSRAHEALARTIGGRLTNAYNRASAAARGLRREIERNQVAQLRDRMGGGIRRGAIRGFGTERTNNQGPGLLGRMGGAVGGGIAAMGRTALALGTVGVAGVAALGRAVVRVGSNAESTRIAMAGVLVAANAVGEGTGPQRMARGMVIAQGAMARIRRDAASLPGEAEDFVQVFRMALPAALTSGERSIDRITDLTNTLTAIGISQQTGGAPEIGRDVRAMLGGRTTAVTDLFSQALAPRISDAARGMGLRANNAQEFNRLSGSQRFAVLERAAASFGPMLQAASNTWEARAGTFWTAIRETFQRVTGPVFTRLSDGLGRVNTFLETNSGMLEEFFGGMLSRGEAVLSILFDVGQRAFPIVRDVIDEVTPALRGLWETIQPHLGPLAESLGSLMRAAAPLAAQLIDDLAPAVPIVVAGLRELAAAIEVLLSILRIVAPSTTTSRSYDRASGTATQSNVHRASRFSMFGGLGDIEERTTTSFDATQARVAAAMADEARKTQNRNTTVSRGTMAGAVQQTNNTTVNVVTPPGTSAQEVAQEVHSESVATNNRFGGQLQRALRGSR